MNRLALLPLAFVSGLSACANPPPGAVAAARGAPRQCFLASQVHGFGHATDSSVDVWAGASRYYRLDLIGPCHDINWSSALVLRTTGGGSWICEGADAEIILPGPVGGRCLVSGVHPITKEQWNARGR
ncbi:MAG: DUF6491 family protein [Sphingomicrobium sp.]